MVVQDMNENVNLEFNKFPALRPASDQLHSSLLEAESGLGQNMKVIGNDVI